MVGYVGVASITLIGEAVGTTLVRSTVVKSEMSFQSRAPPRAACGMKPARSSPPLQGPQQRSDVLEIMEKHFNDVYRQLEVQLKRMAQIQAEIDVLNATVRALKVSNTSAS